MCHFLHMQGEHDEVIRIIKLGGSAITVKHEFESLNENVLDESIQQIKLAIEHDRANGKYRGTIIVHGAGSFGHFQASKFKVNRGSLNMKDDLSLQEGFAKTRQSVCKLNLLVLQKLNDVGIYACGVAGICNWSMQTGQLVSDGCEVVKQILQRGLVPVLHGDVILDSNLGCKIISGDLIIQKLALYFKPQTVIFLTNVRGIYDRPPEQEGAQLISEITVQKEEWKAFTKNGTLVSTNMETANHDTTGGIEAKVQESSLIAQCDIPVVIVEAGSQYSKTALLLDNRTQKLPDDWLGTIITRAIDD